MATLHGFFLGWAALPAAGHRTHLFSELTALSVLSVCCVSSATVLGRRACVDFACWCGITQQQSDV
jgi:hypothetical protein